MILFWKLNNSTHWPHLVYNPKHCEWYYTVPYVEIFNFVYPSFHMDTKGGNWLYLNHFLSAHLPLTTQKRWYIQGDSKGEKILHSKPLICHDRVSSVKWQIDNLSVRDMASLELANRGSRGEYSLVSAIQVRAKFQKHKIYPWNGYSTDCCLRSTIQMAQMFLFKPLPQSTKS